MHLLEPMQAHSFTYSGVTNFFEGGPIVPVPRRFNCTLPFDSSPKLGGGGERRRRKFLSERL